MAYIDEGEGDAIVFRTVIDLVHLWRNIIRLPRARSADCCDLIGQGDSDKLRVQVLTDTATSNSAASFMRFGISLISVAT